MHRLTTQHIDRLHDKSLCKKCENQINKSIPSLYLAKEINGAPKADIFPSDSTSPRGIRSQLSEELRYADELENACMAVIPHEWEVIKPNRNYIKYMKNLSQSVPLVIFNTGDRSRKINLKNVIEIRTFLHPWENRHRKILIPYPVRPREYIAREWSKIPTISFMGQVPPLSVGSLTSSNLKCTLHPIKSSPYFIRRIMVVRAKKLSTELNIKVVTRNSFSAIHKNPDFERQSNEFQEQLDSSDYVLCPRGFGNTSMRFYEALSAGRTPILIETNGGTPFSPCNTESDKNFLTVNLFSDWERIISEDWERLRVENQYLMRQKANCELFSKHLSFEPFMRKVFIDFLRK